MVFVEEWREWRLTGLLYSYDLALCNLKVRVGRFLEECRRRNLKVSANKCKVMVLCGQGRLKCESTVDVA